MFRKVSLFNKGSEQDLVERQSSIGVGTGLPLPPLKYKMSTSIEQQQDHHRWRHSSVTIWNIRLHIDCAIFENNWSFTSMKRGHLKAKGPQKLLFLYAIYPDQSVTNQFFFYGYILKFFHVKFVFMNIFRHSCVSVLESKNQMNICTIFNINICLAISSCQIFSKNAFEYLLIIF